MEDNGKHNKDTLPDTTTEVQPATDAASDPVADSAKAADSKPESPRKARKQTAKAESQSSSETSTEALARKSRWPAALLFILVLLALSFGGYSFWLGQQRALEMTQLSQQLQGMQRQLETAQSNQSQLQQLEQLLVTENQRLQQALDAIGRQTAHNDSRIAELAGSDRQDWLVAEAEYLMRLANQRLNLEGDVTGAQAMLEAADKVLLETRNPAFDSVRQQLALEINALRRVPGVDRVGAVSRLQAMQDALDKVNWMPLARLPQASPDDSASSTSQTWYGQLWGEVVSGIGSIIRIRRQDTPMDIPMSPEQAYYLQQNVRLMLEQAQLAMLRSDQTLYDRSLKRVAGWVNQYLPEADQGAAAMSELLAELQRWKVDAEAPDISRSLGLLRQRMSISPSALPADPAPEQGENP